MKPDCTSGLKFFVSHLDRKNKVNIPAISPITLSDLIQVKNPELHDEIRQGRIVLIRHSMDKTKRPNEDWRGIDNLLRFDKELLMRFTAGQVRDVLGRARYTMVFVKWSGTRCLLRGSFEVKGRLDPKEAHAHYPDASRRYDAFRVEKGMDIGSEVVLYDLSPAGILQDLNDRLVIEWGGNTRLWHQSALEKPVFEILPPGFVSAFPGWEQVHLNHSELQAIVKNPDGNRDWYQFLTQHDGVYVIHDRGRGMNYVGSAYGSDQGIWGRWRGYAKTGHNNNKGLVELNPENFMYSLHHVWARSAQSKQEVLRYEYLLQEKLGSRGEDLLNRNGFGEVRALKEQAEAHGEPQEYFEIPS